MIAAWLGIAIETVGSWLDAIPSWPWYRSKATIARLDREDAELWAKWGEEAPDDDEPRRQWFGVISGYGCCWGICRKGIELQERRRP